MILYTMFMEIMDKLMNRRLSPASAALFYVLSVLAVPYPVRSAQEPTRVFSLQTDIWAEPRSDVYLRYNFTGKRNPLKEMTICYRFNIQQFRDGSHFLSYATADDVDNALLFYQREDKVDFYYNDILASVYMLLKVEDTLDVWHHHCHLISFPNYKFYTDGELKVSGHMAGDTANLYMNGTVYVGQDQDSYAGGLDKFQSISAYIAQINWWSYLLTEQQIREIASCQSNLKGDILSSDVHEFEVANATVEYRNISFFCKENNNEFVIIPEKWHLHPSIKFCKVSNSEVYVPDTNEANDKLFNETRQFIDQCGGKSYRLLRLGVTDKDSEGIWKKFDSSETISYTAWAPGEPSEGLGHDCIVMTKDFNRWGDVICKDKYCFSCLKDKQKYLQIRGLCHDQEHHTRFILDGYINKFPFLRGYYGHAIFMSNDRRWILKDNLRNITMAIMENRRMLKTDYPLGRHMWKVLHPFCDHLIDDEIKLSLSSCSTHEFTCDDGLCVARNARCNLLSDCQDGSDEENCNLLEFQEGYHGHRPPPGRNLHNPLEIIPTINIIRFSNIDDINLAVNMELEVMFAWRDRNLRYKNLKDKAENKLSPDEINRAWLPEFEFLNVNDGRLKKIKTTVFVKKTGEPHPPDFNDVEMDTVFPSASGVMVQRILYSASFNCYFSLFYYPFDVQNCYVLLRLTSATSVVIVFKNASVTYQGLMDLPKYTVGDLKAGIHNYDGNDALEATFQLERRYSLLVLAIFIPTALLLGIGYTTLFIKLQLLQVRAIMTLTTLLVLYTLFNQVSSALPDTAYIKMIDVWFFFCIFLIFSVIVLHILVENMRPGTPTDAQIIKVVPSKSSQLKALTSPKRARTRVLEHITANCLLHFVRAFLYPITVIVFNAIFWIMILSK